MNDSIYETDNLFAWCIASHDPPTRTAEDRAQMLHNLGIRGYAWGNRMAAADQLPKFHAEMDAMTQRGIKLVGRYINATYDAKEMKAILDSFKAYDAHPELWLSPGHPSEDKPDAQRAADEATRLRPTAEAAAEVGLKVGLYNHAGWFGDPINLISIIQQLQEQGVNNVGLAFCLHWCHEWVDRFEMLLPKITPHLLSMSISGVFRDGNTTDRQFPPVGAGEEDIRLLSTLVQSQWRGPVGLINHTSLEAEPRLRDHLDGLKWVRQRMTGESPPPPRWRIWS